MNFLQIWKLNLQKVFHYPRIHKIKNIFEFDRIANSELVLIYFEINPSNENNFNK